MINFNFIKNYIFESKLSKTLALTLVFIFSVFFTACENFTQAALLKQKIDEKIEYENAESYKVRVLAEQGTGSIIVGAGENELKVTDSLKVSFQKNSGYKFVEWRAVSRTDNSSMDEYVKFEPKDELETKITLLIGSDDINIIPICESSLSLLESYPADDDEGVPKDSSIKLVFNSPLSQKNDLSRVNIEIDGSNVKGSLYFNEPQIIDNQLVLTAKTTNRISVIPGELKRVTVSIPEDFIYDGKNGNFEIGEILSHTYRINSTTSDKTFITYGSDDENAGTFKVNGIAAPAVSQQYSIGEVITVTYKVKDGYEFTGWECSDRGAIVVEAAEGDEYDESGFNQATQIATAKLTIINQSKNATFTVKTEKIPTVQLEISNPEDESGILKVNGVVANGDVKEYRKGDVVSLTFKKNDAYKFLGWNCSNETVIKIEPEIISNVTDNYGLDFDTKIATAKFTVLDGSDTKITVNPIAPKIDEAYIVADSSYGRFSTNVTNTYKEGDTQVLNFTADSDYQFIRWRVLNVDGDNEREVEYDDYIKIETLYEANTEFTLKKAVKTGILRIEPLCEIRPKVTFVLPQNGEKNIVRNRAIRIVFSKPIDETSLKENLHIYEGVQRVVGGDLIYDKTEISDKVDFELSSTKKTLFIKLKDGMLFNPSSYVSVNIDKKLQDEATATFENDYTLQFQTSNYVDSLAPKINKFMAGLNDSFTNLTVLEQDESDFKDISDGNALSKDRYSTFGVNANAITINDPNHNNYLNFYIDAGDIAGAKTVAGEDTKEDDVKSILIRITRYKTNSDGKMTIDESFASDTQYIPYRGSDYSEDTMSINGKTAEELLKSIEKESGCFATYDLNNLTEDGLYRFDVSTEDMDGNNGLDEEFWENHGNGFKSVFVAKDTKTLTTGKPEWINSSNTVDTDYVFRRIESTGVDKILRIPYDQTYFGIKEIELKVDKCENPFDSANLKVRYGATESYSSTLPEIEIDSESTHGSTLALKEYNASYVPGGYLFIENLCLGSEHGEVKINAKLTDRFEAKIQQTEEEVTSIIAYNDQEPPYFKGGSAGSINDDGLTTVDYEYSVGSARENVWPRPGNPGVKSTEFWDSPNIVNGDGVPVRWFYTNAKVNSDYCVRLNFNLVEDKRYVKIYAEQHSSSLLTDDVLSVISADNTNGTLIYDTRNSSVNWDYTFTEGTWSVVLKDYAGNLSPAYTFVIIKDVSQPDYKLDGNVDMRSVMTLENMSGITKSFDGGEGRWGDNTNRNSIYWFDYWDGPGHSSKSDYDMSTSKIYLRGTTENLMKVTLDVNFNGTASGLNYQNNAVSRNCYSESKPSRTKSGIAQFSFNWAWKDWNTCNGEDFLPAYPKETNFSNVDYRTDRAGRTSKDNMGVWEDYTAGTNISWPIYHQWNSGIKYQRFPPLTLFLKDGCGNMTWVKVDRQDQGTRWNWSWGFIHE